MRKIIVVILFVTFVLAACVDERATTTDKPVIYLYPEEVTNVNVILNYDGKLSCTYPEYDDGWNVKAYPDGKLINNKDSQEYSYLFWEGRDSYKWEINAGFVVKGDDTETFLQEKLKIMGLTAREYNEFIVYWLPIMKDNPYNSIYFAGEEYNELAKLTIEPKPESLLRVFMVFKSLEKPIEIKEQKLSSFERRGFTVVEWGGTQIN